MNVILAAGGTGGHMVPAHALAAELKARGHGVALVTDERGAQIPGLFDGRAGPYPARRAARRRADRLDQGGAGRCSPGGAQAQARSTASSGPTRWSASAAIRPSRRCSRRARREIPTILHEQNAVLGRVNRLLAGEAEAIATAYDEVERLKPALPGQDGAGRQSGARSGRAAGRSAAAAVRRDRAAEDPGHRRKPGRDACSARWCPTGWARSRRRSATGCRSSSNAAPTTSRRCARAMPSSAFRPSCRPISPTCPPSSPTRIWSSPAPAPRPSPS